MKYLGNRSRFKHHLQKQANRNILFVLLGGIVLVTLLFIFGTNLLIGFSLLLGKFTGSDEAPTTSQSQSYIAPPIMDIPVEATSSATIALSGSVETGDKVELYKDDSVVGKTKVTSKKTFSFDSVELEDGENVFKARVVSEDNKSEFSNEVTVSYASKPPELTVDSPQEDKVYRRDQGPVKISGKTDPGVNVTVNDFRAIVDDEGNFSYLYTLKEGDNALKIVATDPAGNKTNKDLTIRTE